MKLSSTLLACSMTFVIAGCATQQAVIKDGNKDSLLTLPVMSIPKQPYVTVCEYQIRELKEDESLSSVSPGKSFETRALLEQAILGFSDVHAFRCVSNTSPHYKLNEKKPAEVFAYVDSNELPSLLEAKLKKGNVFSLTDTLKMSVNGPMLHLKYSINLPLITGSGFLGIEGSMFAPNNKPTILNISSNNGSSSILSVTINLNDQL